MKKVQFVELTVQNKVLPLTSGYLQAYACKDPEIASNYSFSQISERLNTPRARVLRQLLDANASIYAFTCYVWNMGLVRDVVDELAKQRPDARFILGGAQVTGHGAKYLDRCQENIYICNGEGEPVWRDFLKADLHGSDFSQVAGLTFWRTGQVITTPPQPLMRDINDIPSPFLSGMFRSNYSMTIFETNRGCPYQCTFCYWGRGDDLTVRKFDEQRVREELEWIAKAKILMVFIADANWGLLPRDVAISEYIVELKKRYGFPMIVNFSAAKDKPKRSAEIATMFAKAGIITSQALGIQSESDVVLEKIKRKNIKLEVLQEVRKELDTKDVSTFVELIWPLPGETKSSFKESLNKMCTANVSTIVVYPALLLHSTPMESQVEELGIKTKRTLDPVEDLQLIIETNEVCETDYYDGMWTAFGLYTLYNCCALRHTGKFLQSRSIVEWADLFTAFGEYCRSREVAIARYWRQALDNMKQAEFAVLGRVVHEVLHAHRVQFVLHLSGFAEAQPWWNLEEARALFELDLLELPYVYSPNQIHGPRYGWKHLRLERSLSSDLAVMFPEGHLSLLENSLSGKPAGIRRYGVTYKKQQFPFMPSKSIDENAAYCHGMIQRLAAMKPSWRPLGAAASSV
jgi:radical SAM superfamily enzyme YgiQ (UPF0313 family)